MGEDLWNHKVDNSFLVYVTMYCTVITIKRMKSAWTMSVWTKVNQRKEGFPLSKVFTQKRQYNYYGLPLSKNYFKQFNRKHI